MRLFIFGPGYVGLAFARRLMAAGWSVAASARGAGRAADLAAEGVEPADPADPAALAGADAVLITAPPDSGGCPGLAALAPALAQGAAAPRWIGYLSSSSVYGDRDGGWVFEDSALCAQSVAGARRVAAERAWLDLGARLGLTVTTHRLAGIYGPARSVFERLRAGRAQRIVRPGQVFSRIHLDDLTGALAASLARPRPSGVYNLCDDEPAPPQDVIVEAARLLAVAPPPAIAFDAADLSAASQRFFGENKRLSNARAKAELSWRLAYPSYREGLRAILAAEAR